MPHKFTTMKQARVATRFLHKDSERKASATGRSKTPKAHRASGNPTKYITENLSYPIDVDSDPMQGHYIMFLINTVTSATLHGTLKGPENVSTVRRGTKVEQMRRTLSTQRPSTKRLSSSISLYMPPSVQVSYGAGYTDHDIEVGAEAVIAGITSGLGAAKGALAGQISAIMAKTASKYPGAQMGGLDALIQIGSGVAKSGRLEMLFNRMSRRSFTYTFTFVPKSQEESLIVQRIIFLFKSSMHPEYGSAEQIAAGIAQRVSADKLIAEASKKKSKKVKTSSSSSGRNLLIPDTFDIEYHYASTANNYMNRISTCYLESLNVTYGGDRFRAYDVQEGIFGDGAPPQNIVLQLGFKEMEILTRESIHEGF